MHLAQGRSRGHSIDGVRPESLADFVVRQEHQRGGDENLVALADLCDALGDADAGTYRDLSRAVVEAMIAHMYDEETAAFYDIYTRSREKIRVLTPTIFSPW